MYFISFPTNTIFPCTWKCIMGHFHAFPHISKHFQTFSCISKHHFSWKYTIFVKISAAVCLMKSFAKLLEKSRINTFEHGGSLMINNLCQNLKTVSVKYSGCIGGTQGRAELCCGGGAVHMAAPCKSLPLVEWASGL
jgi:hypothetical protein